MHPQMADRPQPLSDVEILAQPSDQSIRALLAYWMAKRGDRTVPLRQDIDPIALKDHLPSLFMLDVLDEGRDFRYRLVGTMIAAMSGRDVTGAKLRTLYEAYPDALAEIARLFGPVISERRPVFARGTVFWRPERDYRRFEAGYFPLSTGGETVDIILSEIRFL
jgi:hypothetical protein